jgi:hypothetical protein
VGFGVKPQKESKKKYLKKKDTQLILPDANHFLTCQKSLSFGEGARRAGEVDSYQKLSPARKPGSTLSGEPKNNKPYYQMHLRLLTLQNPSPPERVPKGRVRSLNFFRQVPLAPKKKEHKECFNRRS